MTGPPVVEDSGIEAVQSGDSHWAWYGVHVDAAMDLQQQAEAASVDSSRLVHNAGQNEQAYLAGVRGDSNSVHLRWYADTARQLTELSVLGVTSAGSRPDVVRAAQRIRSRLALLPNHVIGRPITDRNDLLRRIYPFNLHPLGMVELRKRWLVDRRSRPDVDWPYYLSVPWLRELPDLNWPQLLMALRTHGAPVCLDVALKSVRTTPALRAVLSERATTYARLSREGELKAETGIWEDSRRLTPDAAAISAAALYDDAVQRYNGDAFILRISLMSPAELGDDLVLIVRDLLGPPEASDNRGFRTAQLVGSPLVSLRPTRPDEVAIFTTNFERLTAESWGRPALPPEAEPEYQRVAFLGDLADAREAATVFRFPTAVNGSLPGFAVERSRDASIVHQKASDRASLQIGEQHDFGGGGIGVTVPLSSLSSHGLIVGTTGSGKTNTVLHLLEQLWAEHAIPFLVIEPVNSERDDYRWLLGRPGFEDMTVFTVGDESLAPFRLNPFEVPQGVRISTYLAGLVSCFDAAFGLDGPLPFLYRKALRQMYEAGGISPDEVSAERHNDRWPRLSDLVAAFAALPDIDRYAGEVRSNITAASRLRTESLLIGSCGRTLDAAMSYPLDRLLDRPIVIELAAAGDDDREQALITALLLNALTAHYKASRTNSDLAHVTVIEEAHRLLRRPLPAAEGASGSAGRAAEQFANTLAENRKYGEGLLIVEQVPAKLIEDAHKNTALKVMHHLPSEDDREAIAATMNLSNEQRAYARSIRPLEAFITHREMGGRAALVTVPNVRQQAASAKGMEEDSLPDNDVVRKRFESFATADSRLWESLQPYAGCAGCRFPCRFKGIGEVLGGAMPAIRTVRAALSKSTYPPPGAEQDARWRALVAEFGVKVEEYSEFGGHQRQDLAACVFLHATRAAFPTSEQSTTNMVSKFRRVSSAEVNDA
jgi:hypothetical protein